MNALELYQRLADLYHDLDRPQERDRFLVLALDAAYRSGQQGPARQLHARLLQQNPQHLIKPYGSLQEAMASPNFTNYLTQLRKNFPPEKAEGLLRDLQQGATGPKLQTLPGSPLPGWGTRAAAVEPASSPVVPRMQIDIRTQPGSSPTQGTFSLRAESQAPMNPASLPPQPPDPLANEPLRLPPPAMPKRPGMAARPTSASPASAVQEPNRDKVYSSSGALIGNILFVLVLSLSLAAIGYVLIWPVVK